MVAAFPEDRPVDPAIEPESGELWSVLYARLWRLHLAVLQTVRELLDRSAEVQK